MARAAAGYLINRLNVNKFKMMLGTILSYIPEAIFTAIVFVYIYIYPPFYRYLKYWQ